MLTAAVLAIGRPTFDLDLGAEQVGAARSLLTALGVEVQGRDDILTERAALDGALDELPPDEFSRVVVLQATFSDSSLVSRIADRLTAPMVVWSFPEPRTGDRLRLNSMCGANLAAYLLRRRAHPVRFVHVDPTAVGAGDLVRSALDGTVGHPDVAVSLPSDTNAQASLRSTTASGARFAAALRGARIGVVGVPPPGFEPCEGASADIQRVTGIHVDRIPLDALFDEADAAEPSMLTATTRRVLDDLRVEPEVAAAGLDRSVALYGGLRGLANRRGWSGLATRCWPECMTEYGGAACTPMAMLTEDGVPSVCEADVYGAVTALILRRIGGSDPFVADLVDADLDDDTSVVWHCGVAPLSLAEPGEQPIGITHPNRHRALANEFALRPGPVTVARLSQAGGALSMVVGSGQMLHRPRPFHGTCGVLRWDRPVSDVLATVFGLGLEHHLGIVYGDHRAGVVALAGEWGVPVVELGSGAASDSATG